MLVRDQEGAGVRDLHAAVYQVDMDHPSRGEGCSHVAAVSAEHAVKIALADYLDVQYWDDDLASLFFHIATKDLYRFIPELNFSVKYLGREVEA